MIKYYIPKIEELHIGFELDYQDKGSQSWNSIRIISGEDLDNIGNVLIGDNKNIPLRVKYLDKEDIESLGFTFRSLECITVFQNGKHFELKKKAWVTKEFINNVEYVLSVEKDEYIIEAVSPIRLETVFKGCIKNKSELKRLLKQLNILP